MLSFWSSECEISWRFWLSSCSIRICWILKHMQEGIGQKAVKMHWKGWSTQLTRANLSTGYTSSTQVFVVGILVNANKLHFWIFQMFWPGMTGIASRHGVFLALRSWQVSWTICIMLSWTMQCLEFGRRMVLAILAWSLWTPGLRTFTSCVTVKKCLHEIEWFETWVTQM